MSTLILISLTTQFPTKNFPKINCLDKMKSVSIWNEDYSIRPEDTKSNLANIYYNLALQNQTTNLYRIDIYIKEWYDVLLYNALKTFSTSFLVNLNPNIAETNYKLNEKVLYTANEFESFGSENCITNITISIVNEVAQNNFPAENYNLKNFGYSSDTCGFNFVVDMKNIAFVAPDVWLLTYLHLVYLVISGCFVLWLIAKIKKNRSYAFSFSNLSFISSISIDLHFLLVTGVSALPIYRFIYLMILQMVQVIMGIFLLKIKIYYTNPIRFHIFTQQRRRTRSADQSKTVQVLFVLVSALSSIFFLIFYSSTIPIFFSILPLLFQLVHSFMKKTSSFKFEYNIGVVLPKMQFFIYQYGVYQNPLEIPPNLTGRLICAIIFITLTLISIVQTYFAHNYEEFEFFVSNLQEAASGQSGEQLLEKLLGNGNNFKRRSPQVKKIESVLYEVQELICSVCLEGFSKSDDELSKVNERNSEVTDDYLLVTRCEHYFHFECLRVWIGGNNNRCPMCREIVQKYT